jgi:hypothetical protein
MASPSHVLGVDDAFKRLHDSYISYSSAKNPMQLAKAKAQVRSTALELVSTIQTPEETAMAFATSNSVYSCYRAAGDCGILTPWPKETMTAQELADKTGADIILIGKLTTSTCSVLSLIIGSSSHARTHCFRCVQGS